MPNLKFLGKVAVGALAFIVAEISRHMDLIPTGVQPYVTYVIAFAGLLGIYYVPYEPRPGYQKRRVRVSDPPGKI